MKALVILVVLGALACGAAYFFGGIASFDPSAEGRKAMQAITPGMTLQQVLDLTGQPNQYRQMVMRKKKRDGVEIEVIEPAPAVKFDRARLFERVASNDVPHGFIIPFVYSRSVAFDVHFDGSGTVTDVTTARTEADLYQIQP